VSFLVNAVGRRSLAGIRHVSAVRPGGAEGLVAQVYHQVERDFGLLAPPMALHSPAPPTLAAAWLMLRETLVATNLLDRATKEAVATAVSAANSCPYCVDVHGTTLNALVPSQNFPETTAWARAASTAGTAVACPADQAPELIGVVCTFHYLNRMVNVFLPDTPVPSGLPGMARNGALRFLGTVIRPTASRAIRPGDSLDLLPAAELPADMAWTTGNADIAQAFARTSAVLAAAGEQSVPGSVRALVEHELDKWHGDARGPSRAWVSELVADLPAAERPAGRLALLTAFASYMVDASVVEEFRRIQPADRALVELTSWAGFAAARRVGSWIPSTAG
jgi:AhpD family alkylhydroperoxidase